MIVVLPMGSQRIPLFRFCVFFTEHTEWKYSCFVNRDNIWRKPRNMRPEFHFKLLDHLFLLGLFNPLASTGSRCGRAAPAVFHPGWSSCLHFGCFRSICARFPDYAVRPIRMHHKAYLCHLFDQTCLHRAPVCTPAPLDTEESPDRS